MLSGEITQEGRKLAWEVEFSEGKTIYIKVVAFNNKIMYQGRIEKFSDKFGLAYGNDYICGLFLQIWKLNPAFGAQAFENHPDDENLVVDRDNLSGTLTVKELVAIAEKYGFDLSHELPEETINYD